MKPLIGVHPMHRDKEIDAITTELGTPKKGLMLIDQYGPIYFSIGLKKLSDLQCRIV
jgi:hypothetical protein